jgi:hypothetical protein
MPWSNSRPQGNGTDAKYRTVAHRQARAALLARFQPGDPCCLCGHPMYGPTRNLDADHYPGTDQYRGLAHGNMPCPVCRLRCNRSDGARRGRGRQGALRGFTRPDW